ncbi:ATP-dependent bile acid permease [Rhizodiscina lignyota]|uniref:ATP-dependent bile acid permease n=1 Tax=Rhizodiscina lignyota TaxID=1504668 RepID=A0A9P4IPG1_9PEZI|nr:ATP-dependent bile acid permease [Rhizodiscina lignyota]
MSPIAAASWVTALHATLIAGAAFSTIIAVLLAAKSARQKRNKSALYEDADGVATEETQSRYNKTIKWLFIFLGLFSPAGLGTAIAYGVGDIFEQHQRYRSTASGCCICIVTANVIVSKNPVARFNVALFGAFSSIMLCGNVLIEHAPLPGTPVQRGFSHSETSRILAAVNSIVALVTLYLCLSIPRAPQLFLDGRVVQPVNSVSFISRNTFSWPSPYLALAWASKQLDFPDLDALDSMTRAKDLYESYMSWGPKYGIFKLMIYDHAMGLTWQYIITIIDAFIILLPQMTMYRLLLVLEARDNGEDVGYRLWMWVLCLGITVIIQGGVNNAMWFISYCRVNIPWRIQLSALVFAKAMRKKDVKGSSSKDKDPAASVSEETLLGEDPSPKKEEDEEEDPEATLQKMRQGVINLIGVDANRIAMFGTFNNAFLGAIFRLAVAFTFLGQLLGWQALLAGIAVQAAFMPINIYFSKRYSDSQDMLMKVRDKKLAALNEALNGIRQIKFSALENRWQKKIGDVREEELNAQWRVFTSDVILLMCWILGPVLLSAASIAVYAVVHGTLPPSVAFTTIAVLAEIEGTLAYIPELTTNALDAWVSIKRIRDYLNTPEKEDVLTPGDDIHFDNATLAWPSDDEVGADAFKLNGVNIQFPTGELSVISGRTGSGKSLLLASILGEAEILHGSVTVPKAPPLSERFDTKANKGNWIIPSAIAFVCQQPWIENRTFRDNVTFDLPFDEERYRKVLSACALEKDVLTLSDGELTEIGANGINLSGGQRWRITLARALYSRAGILIMDDIFSAVDSHVGKHIFENALTGDLASGRTRILVTHHVSLALPATMYEVQLGDGKVDHAGFVDELRRNNVLENIVEAAEEEVLPDEEVIDEVVDDSQITQLTSGVEHMRRASHLSAIDNAGTQDPRKFVEEEKREEGRIKFSVYGKYFKASGGPGFWIFVFTVFAGYQGLLLLRSWILRLWTEKSHAEAMMITTQSHTYNRYASAYVNHSTMQPIRVSEAMDSDMKFYLSLYLGLAVFICIEGTLRYLLVFYGSIKASRRLFNQLTYAVLRAPLRWLDTVPVGRILNRFTADFNILDSQLAYYCSFLIYNGLVVIGIVVAAVIVSPLIILCAAILFSVCWRYAMYFLAGAREAKRLESVAKSPIFEFFSTALQGVTTVRAFAKAQTYVDQMFKKLDTYAETCWYQWICNRWLGWRLTAIGAVFAVVTAALVVSLKGIDAALGGFALAFTLNYTDSIIWLLRNYAMVELGMNATERIIEYGEIAIEDQSGADAPAIWPTEGRVEVSDLVVGYAPDLPAVLKGLTFSVERNERVGVVGRTGAGKSSLTLALFRFLEPREGSIHIDGIDISKIKLEDLRSRLSIIAQDPVLFSGTIRTNLDPFNEYPDHELREALERVHLVPSSSAASTIAVPDSSHGTQDGTHTPGNINIFRSLTSTVTEGGQNLSQGQRQLLCLARAIVARPKVMVLDEATSAVDKATDELIQRSIRDEFRNSTLIVIAHRLSTIADFDRILVMSDGKVAEFDTPKKLLETEDGVFRAMVEDSGERDVLKEMIMG